MFISAFGFIGTHSFLRSHKVYVLEENPGRPFLGRLAMPIKIS